MRSAANFGFDPQSDAIVRVEAARLRRALETYFAGEGRKDPIVIELPTGHYVPIFQGTWGVDASAGAFPS